jgi:Cof subfamily protein (haloacid dehalogenase superfamily)
VTKDNALTERAIAAVIDLREAGVAFAVTSGRPPRGMSMLIEPLGLETPIASFNGGLFTHPDMSVIMQRTIPDDVAPVVIEILDGHGVDVWVYKGADWFVRDVSGPHVERESSTVGFEPTVVDSFASLSTHVAKIVGVSDDHDAVHRAVSATRELLGDHVSAARSQPYYADITHPEANKGEVVTYLSKTLNIPIEAIATIGDMPNDVLMFSRSGLSIAMGNATEDVQRTARRVTTSNEQDGFADAVSRFVLPNAATAGD